MKQLFANIVALIVIFAIGAAAYYVGHRLRILLGVADRWLIPAVFIAIVVGTLAAAMVAVRSTSPVVGQAYVCGGYAFTLFLYLFVLLVVHHGIQLVWRPPEFASGMTIVALALLATTIGAIQGLHFSVRETTIPILHLKQELKVLQLSDLHLGHHRGRNYLAQVVAESNRQKPDLILITGDLVDSNVALLPGVLDPLSALSAPAYFITGNHDKTVDLSRALAQIADKGVRILNNEVVETHGVQLIGLSYMNADETVFDMHPSEETRTIKSVLETLPLKQGTPKILMHHSPVGLRYAEAAGIDLAVSGHTHAGQIFPFTLLTEFIFPFNRGLHQQGKTRVFVSEGAGTYMLRARLGSANEINLLRLVPEITHAK